MRDVTVEQALAHPTWRMGPKITIDSATLMNKGLEVIEAHWLFGMPYDQIEVVIHPQSVIHSMVEFVDDSIKMQASLPDMHLPIQYALSYPARLSREGPRSPTAELARRRQLDFEAVDMARFPCLRLAYEAGRRGGTAPAALVGAMNRRCRSSWRGKIRLTDIAAILEDVLARHTVVDNPDLETVLATCSWAQDEVLRLHGEPTTPHERNSL